MKLGRWFRLALLATLGGMILQTATCCPTQVAEEFAAAFVQAASPALVSAITSSLQASGGA